MRGGITVPFYIPASAAGVGASVQVSVPGVDVAVKVALHVVSGGPVFLWRGRVPNSDAYVRSHNAQSIDFDFAASANGTEESIIEGEGFSVVTLASDNETIGFLELVPCP